MVFSLQGRGVFREGQSVIVMILCAAVLGLFVVSIMSSFLENRKERF